MDGKFRGYGEDDEDDVLAPKEPQVASQDPGERKAARALRIRRRQDAQKRAEQPSDEAAIDEEPGLIEQSTATAAEQLQRLALDGAAKVTNVKVTTDEREVIRRSLFSDKMRTSMQKIEEEATDAQTQYEVITNNWGPMLEIKDPLDIDAAIKEQKKKCDALLQQKNGLIDELKCDLKRMDQAYYDDLEKQDKDIKELSDRIEKQVTIMQRAYEKQLSLIERAVSSERGAAGALNARRWDALYKRRDREELHHMEYKFQQLEEHKQEVEAIMWDHHGKYREAKIELESLIQELQKEMEKLKATCIINTEKIGYNYQVLKKREEENVFVRSQQKRRLNKMSDAANTLRARILAAGEAGAAERARADADVHALRAAMDDLEKKAKHFAHVNHYKFTQVWRMSAAQCSSLWASLRAAEASLHAHVLGAPAPPPPPSPPECPLGKLEHEEMNKTAPSTTIVRQELIDPNNMVAKEAKDKLVRHILQLVADNTGFLVEDRLLRLIEKYQLSARNLCTLDSIFMALEIQAEEDIELLCSTFLNYAFCPVCVGMDTVSDQLEHLSITSGDDHVSQQTGARESSKVGRGSDRHSIRGRQSIGRSISASTSRSQHIGFRGHELSPADQQLLSEADEILQKCGDPRAGPSSVAAESPGPRRVRGVTVSAPALAPGKKHNPFLCPVGHHLEIEPMQVLTALGEFISVFVPPEKRELYDLMDNVKPPDFGSPSRKLKPEEIEAYWSQWKDVFPAEKDRFWDGILAGLNKYLPILQERDRLHSEVVVLRRRNAALRRLVRGALPAPPPPGRPLAHAPPRYLRPRPPAMVAPYPDVAPDVRNMLPPI